MQHAERIGRSEQHAGGRDLQMVRFIFTKLLHRRTRPNSLDDELRTFKRLSRDLGNPCFMGQGVEEPYLRSFQTWLGIALENNLQPMIDLQTPRSLDRSRRKRYNGKGYLRPH